MSRRRDRIDYLRTHHFTPLEARELSRLPKSSPALKLMVKERVERRDRFEKLAASKIATGRWKRGQVGEKWVANLTRLYSKKHLRVKQGPTGKQQVMKKGQPNPWALYRDAVRRTGGDRAKGHVSPWEVKAITSGKTPLEKGLIFVQQAEKKGHVNQEQVQRWLEQKRESIKRARGKHRAQLQIEYRRLEKLL